MLTSGPKLMIVPRPTCSRFKASWPNRSPRKLKAKLSPQQKAEIEERPTQDLDAFELYLQAKTTVDSYVNATDVRAALLQAVKSLDEAIKRDSNFVSAYCCAAHASALNYF